MLVDVLVWIQAHVRCEHRDKGLLVGPQHRYRDSRTVEFARSFDSATPGESDRLALLAKARGVTYVPGPLCQDSCRVVRS
jgi:hypothetical protein